MIEPYPVPISYRGQYHYRSGSTKQVLTGAALDRFLLGKTGRHWDGVPVPGMAVSGLSGAALTRFRERASYAKRLRTDALNDDDPGLLEKLRLIEGEYLKRAAILLFHTEPERFFTGATVKIGYFENDSDLRYHDDIHGDLFTQVSTTIDRLLTRYLKAAISYEGLQRVETYPVPESALREVVLNAVVHRDYAVTAPIQIRVYADRLYIWNPGELPRDWSVANLLGQHASRPFNPDVANAFFQAGEIEAWGLGIQRVFNACRVAGTPEPRIAVEPGELWVEFPFAEAYPDSVAASRHPDATGSTSQETSQETGQETSQEKILALLREDPRLTRRALAERIGITPSGIRYHLDNLRKAGLIRHVGATRKGHWEILDAGHE